MRVIGGDLGGRRLLMPKGRKVRPTSDRAREAIFSALGDVAGARVLDLYCGSGALAIEALSRGAVHATLVDRDPSLARGNVELFGLRERVTLIGSRLPDWLERTGGAAGAGAFDLVFCDPPYNLAPRLAEQLDHHLPSLLARGGRLIVESSAREPIRLPALATVRQRRYGSTDITFYEQTQDSK